MLVTALLFCLISIGWNRTAEAVMFFIDVSFLKRIFRHICVEVALQKRLVA